VITFVDPLAGPTGDLALVAAERRWIAAT